MRQMRKSIAFIILALALLIFDVRVWQSKLSGEPIAFPFVLTAECRPEQAMPMPSHCIPSRDIPTPQALH